MTAGSGMTYSDLLAEWGHGPTCSSRTCQGCSLLMAGTLWPESFTDWPASATASRGGLTAQPPLEHRTAGTDGGASPILPTPTASQPGGTAEQHLARKNKDGGNRKTVTDLGMVVGLLCSDPTHQQLTDGK